MVIKMKKRFLSAIATVILLSSVTAVTVNADVIMGNDFARQNRNQMIKVSESEWGVSRFIVNSPNGYVKPKKEPGSGEGIEVVVEFREDWRHIYGEQTFKNNEIISISSAYLHEGRYWGVISANHGSNQPGWVPMDELLLAYTGVDFVRENKDSLYEYMGHINPNEWRFAGLLSAEKIVGWQWPGSDREKMIFDKGEDIYNISADAYIGYIYKDNSGREWGEVPYGYKTGDVTWICLNDPENKSNIPMFNPAPKSKKWSPDMDYNWLHNIQSPDTSAELQQVGVVIIFALIATTTAIFGAITSNKRRKSK